MAQGTTDCKVLLPGLAGSYEGNCKKGLASGFGKATGTDRYEGEFKNGLPHGKGKYFWSNGNSYDGEWKKGKMEGYGVQVIKKEGKDSTVTGYWNNNQYTGKSKYPYVINTKSLNIESIRVVKVSDEKNQIEISYYKHDKPIAIYGFGITEREGIYGNVLRTDYTQSIINVTFPFTAEIGGGGYSFDISIYQSGTWRIIVNVLDK